MYFLFLQNESTTLAPNAPFDILKTGIAEAIIADIEETSYAMSGLGLPIPDNIPRKNIIILIENSDGKNTYKTKEARATTTFICVVKMNSWLRPVVQENW